MAWPPFYLCPAGRVPRGPPAWLTEAYGPAMGSEIAGERSGIDWGAHGPTEEQAYLVLRIVGDAAKERVGRTQDPDWGRPHPRSTLAADDARLHPWAVSHTASQAIVTGNDHLCTIAHLLGEPNPVLPAYGGSTLARGALEAGAAALWAVGPDDADVRVRNVLRWETQSKLDLARFGGFLGRDKKDQEADREELMRKVEAAAQLNGVNLRTHRHLTSTAMLQAPHIAEMMRPGDLPPVAAWSAASAFAHGRPWSTLHLQSVEWLPGVREGESRGRITADARVLAWFVWTAHEMLEHAERLLSKRGRPPQPKTSTLRIAAAPWRI